MGFLISAVFVWAAVGVGSRPVTSPLNDAKVQIERIIQETLNENGSHYECGPQLAEELDKVQRHQGLLRKLQRLADDERDRKHKHDYDLADDESDFETMDEEKEERDMTNHLNKTVKEKEEKTEGENTKELMEKPQIEDRGRDDEEERARDLEELLAEEITKKGKEERNDEELKELLKELKKKRYEAVRERESQNGSAKDQGKEKKDREVKEPAMDSMKKKRVEERRKNKVVLMVEKKRVEKELKELLKDDDSKNKLQQERKEKLEELDELQKKMKRMQEEEQEIQGRTEENGVGDPQMEEKTEKEQVKLVKEPDGKAEDELKKMETVSSEMKEPQQKRVMEKASDEATRQFEREHYKNEDEEDENGEDVEDEDEYVSEDEDGQEEEDGDERDEEEDDSEELLQIEAELRKVAAEVRELRRG